MHFSAKRSLAIACHPSVCLSVPLVDCDHLGWKSWKLIAQTISQHLDSLHPKGDPPTLRGTWGNFGEIRGGVGKNGILENKSSNISEMRKDGGKLLWMAYRNLPMLFRMVPSPTPYGLPFPRLGVCNLATPLISGTGEATDFKFGGCIYRANPNKFQVTKIS